MVTSLRLSPPSSPDYSSMEEGCSPFADRIPSPIPSEGSDGGSPALSLRNIVERKSDDIDLLQELPPELREVFENYQNGDLSALEKSLPDVNPSANLLSFVQNLDGIDFSSIAKRFDSDSMLATLFTEVAGLNLDFSGIQSLEDLPQPQALPSTLASLFDEIQQADFTDIDSFSDFLERLPQTPTIKALYLELEELVRPSISLKEIKTLGENDIPLHFRKYTKEILEVKANPLRDLIAALLAYSTGIAPISLMGATLSETERLSSPMKFILAAAPIFSGFPARFWAGKQADKNGGKRSIQFLLGAGEFLALTATLPLYFMSRNVPTFTSLIYSGCFTILSAITRTSMGMTPLRNRGQLITNMGLTATMVGSALMAFSPDIRISLIALAVLGVSNGMIKYGTFAWIRERLSRKLGLANGVAGGLGALGGPFITLAFAGLSLLNRSSGTAYEYLLLPGMTSIALLSNLLFMRRSYTPD